MTKTEINDRATEIENSVAQGEAMFKAQYEAFEKALVGYIGALKEMGDACKQVVASYQDESKALHKELLKLKNRENKPKGDRRITNATICRLLKITESRLKSRLIHMGIMHKHWGTLEVIDTWKNKVRLSGVLRKGKTVNVWIWTPQGRDEFIEAHNKRKW